MWPRRPPKDPHFLYLVRHGRIQKFGHGGEQRVRYHLNAGAEVLQVIRAPRHDVVAAEKALKERYRGRLRRGRRRGLLHTFGAGTEVLPASVRVDLTTVIRGANVTGTFRNTPPAVGRYEA